MKTTAKQPTRPCPCGSKRTLQACCGPYLDGTASAPTAAALMRSRYSAYALKATDYVLRTWHPSTRPEAIEASPGLRWTELEIVAAHDGGPDDDSGTVEFIASFRERGRPGVLHETSRFLREDGRWFYVDGVIQPSPAG